MAAIYGVELKNIRNLKTKEQQLQEADIYLDGKYIGLFLDDNNGGSACIKFSCGKDMQSRFYYVAWRYFASYPEIDSLALYEFTKKDFAEYKTNLPKIDYREWPDEKVAIFFIDKLFYLTQIEEQFDAAVSEGYAAIVVAKYYALKNVKTDTLSVFFIGDTAGQVEQVIDMLDKKGSNYIIDIYKTKSDFEIR